MKEGRARGRDGRISLTIGVRIFPAEFIGAHFVTSQFPGSLSLISE